MHVRRDKCILQPLLQVAPDPWAVGLPGVQEGRAGKTLPVQTEKYGPSMDLGQADPQGLWAAAETQDGCVIGAQQLCEVPEITSAHSSWMAHCPEFWKFLLHGL